MTEDTCEEGWGGDDCSVQQCSIEGEGQFCHLGGECISIDGNLNWHCECREGFTTSGFDCVVTNPKYLDHTISYVFISIGVVLVVAGAIWVFWQYKHFAPAANKLHEEAK